MASGRPLRPRPGTRWPVLGSVLRLGHRLRFGLHDAVWYRPAGAVRFHNQVELQVFGLKRSGNHVIINWMFLNHPGVVCFLNNIRHDIHFNPYLSFGQCFLKDDEGEMNLPRELRSKIRQARDWHRRHPRLDCLILSYEERPLEGVAADPLVREHDRCLGTSGRTANLIILRDPFNTLASRLQRRERMPARPFVAMWKSYAREFLGDTQRLPHRLAINYNRWCIDRGYRDSLARDLGLGKADLGLDEVPKVGGGSSFEGTSQHGRGGAMRTHERWRALADDPEYRDALRDEELADLSRRIFGDIEGTDAIFH